MKFFGQNRHFLANYRGYVNKEWAGYYFSYDFFKAEYKKLKGHDRLEKDLEDLDNKLLAEIQRVHKFLALMVQSVGADIDSVATIVDKLEVSPTKSAEQADQIDRSVEISLRSLYEKINQCDEFFQLNHFVISKTTKKMEKLLAQQEKGTVSVWGGYSSGRFFYDDFSSSGLQIQEIQRKCVDVYTVKFRKKYSQLAKYELKYAKNKDDDHKQTRFYIGAKLGLAIAVVSPSPYTPYPLSPLPLSACRSSGSCWTPTPRPTSWTSGSSRGCSCTRPSATCCSIAWAGPDRYTYGRASGLTTSPRSTSASSGPTSC